jgi:hypothetical protein
MSHQSKKPDCPRCGSSDVLRIVYGLPADASSAGIAAERREGTTSGGCCIATDSPTHECADCEHQWGGGHPGERSEQEEEPADRPASES